MISFQTIETDTLSNYKIHTHGTLICAPRRFGKTEYLRKITESYPLKATLVFPYKFMKDAHDSIPGIIPNQCKGRDGYFCVDEIDLVWKEETLCKLIPWYRVICATTSILNFDHLQASVVCSGVFPARDWIRHVAVMYPRHITERGFE